MPDEPTPTPTPTPEPNSEIESLKAEIASLRESHTKLAAESRREEAAPAKPEDPFDFDRFAKDFAGGKPIEALDYAYEKVAGFRPSEVLPPLTKTVVELTQREQAREAREWMSETEDYVRTPKNAELLLEKVKEMGLPPDARAYRLAWNELKAEETPRVQVRGEGERETRTSAPPAPRGRPSRTSSSPRYTEADLWAMDDDKLLEIGRSAVADA